MWAAGMVLTALVGDRWPVVDRNPISCLFLGVPLIGNFVLFFRGAERRR